MAEDSSATTDGFTVSIEATTELEIPPTMWIGARVGLEIPPTTDDISAASEDFALSTGRREPSASDIVNVTGAAETVIAVPETALVTVVMPEIVSVTWACVAVIEIASSVFVMVVAASVIMSVIAC